MIGDALRLKGGFWKTIGAINDNFGVVGWVIVGVFLGAWAISVLVYRAKGYDDIAVATPNTP